MFLIIDDSHIVNLTINNLSIISAFYVNNTPILYYINTIKRSSNKNAIDSICNILMIKHILLKSSMIITTINQLMIKMCLKTSCNTSIINVINICTTSIMGLDKNLRSTFKLFM